MTQDNIDLSEEELTKQAYNAMGGDWFYSHNDHDFYEHEMHRFQKLLPSGTILEIGACGGRDAKELTALGYGYVGTDIAESFVDIARKEVPGLEFYEQSVFDLSFSGKPLFDGFWAAAVLLHVPKRRMGEALRRIAGVTKPGAIGFISMQDGTTEAIEDKNHNGQTVKRLFARWSKDEFAKALKHSGYEVLDYEYRTHPIINWHCFYVKTPQAPEI